MIGCRIFPHRISDGPGNMALDEVLLDAVGDDPTYAAFRTYSWIAPTLSLGYFQTIAAAEDDPRWRGVPLVRRPTGGGALLHHHELTYALIVPRDHPLSRRSEDLYRSVHLAIANLLESQGLSASRRGEAEVAQTDVTKPFLCFADRNAEDVVSGAEKVVGSAQRRRAGAILQHGSLLISRSALTPELPGIAELAPVDSDPLAWASLLGRAIPAALNLNSIDGDFSSDLLQRADALAFDVYRNSSWTRKR